MNATWEEVVALIDAATEAVGSDDSRALGMLATALGDLVALLSPPEGLDDRIMAAIAAEPSPLRMPWVVQIETVVSDFRSGSVYRSGPEQYTAYVDGLVLDQSCSTLDAAKRAVEAALR